MDHDVNCQILQEYPLQSNFLELIPVRAQRGLSTFDLEFTCLDADGNYIAIGSNVGVVYLVNRQTDNLHKLKDDHKSAVSCVKVLVSLECLVAVGYKDGTVLVYKVPFEENQEIEKFTVEGLHSCVITALEWSKNGIKFFSGDERGTVVCTEIEHFEHQSRSRVLLNENSKVVQLSYSHLNLVVSTLFRSLIYSLKTNAFNQIGQKERKCYGLFGAIIFEDQNDTVYASRPGQRLWKSDLSGTIQETMIFKSALSQSHPSIQTLTRSNDAVSFTDFQFERLSRFQSSILVWCDACFVLIDPVLKVVVKTSPKMDPIMDIATCNNEIFILRGLRHIVRISSEPDPYSSTKVAPEESSLFEEILEPLKGLGAYVKERSDSLSLQAESSSTIFDWLIKKRSASSPPDIETMKISESLPDIVNLKTDDCIPIKIEDSSSSVIEKKSELITKDFTKGGDEDDIVYKVKKKHKKNKKVQFAIDAAPKRERFLNNYNRDDDKKMADSDANKPTDAVLNYENNSQISTHVEENNSLPKTVKNDPVSYCIEEKPLNNNNLSDKVKKNDVDPDQLLENVLSAYSHSKHKDSHSENSTNFVNNSTDAELTGSNSVDQNETIIQSNNNNNSNINNDPAEHLVSNKDTNENNINSDVNDPESRINDSEEAYSSLLLTSTEVTEKPKPEKPQESSLEDSSVSNPESKSNDPPKYGVDWVQYKTPELLLDITVSSDHIFCVDVRNQLYFSRHPQMGSLNWIQLEQPAEKVVASDSETVVWVLYKGTVYTAAHKALCLWENTEWMSIAREVVSIAVDDECGWYAKSNGELVTMQNLTLTKPCGYPETVSCTSHALQVAIKDGVLWVLTVSGSLLARKAADGKKAKTLWKEVVLKNVPGIDSIHLGSKKTGWIIDHNGMIYFIIGVTPETPEGTGELWVVEASNYLFRPTTQLEQVVRKALNTEVLTNLIRGKQHLCLSTCDMGVWFGKTYDNLLYSNQKSIIGHMWESIIPPSTAAATKWSLIAADGINNSEGALWCVNISGDLFCYCIKSKTLIAVELPAMCNIQCIQPNYQSFWLLSANGAIYIRRGITANCLQGTWWQALDLAQFDSQEIIHISCSSFVSWACTADGEIFMRLGSLIPSNSKLNQAWISIGMANEDAQSPLVKFSAIGKHFPLPLIPTNLRPDAFHKVVVGPLGYPVWAVDRKQNVYVREGVTSNLPIGEKWTLIPDLQAKELCISNDAVWVLTASGQIYRRFGVTEKNPFGDYWKQIPGKLDYLSVTEDDDLWGIQNSSMFRHFSFVLYNNAKASKRAPERSISEDDWEDIMEDF